MQAQAEANAYAQRADRLLFIYVAEAADPAGYGDPTAVAAVLVT